MKVGCDANLKDRLDDEIAWAQESFGLRSPLLTFLIQTKLAVLVNDALANGVCSASELKAAISQLSDLQFEISEVRMGQPSPIENSNKYSFSRSDFDDAYASSVDIWQHQIACSLQWNPDHDGLQSRFIYAIGPSGEWRYLPLAQPLELCLTRRNDPSIYPYHPMLALDFGLEVSVAGEVSFLWAANDQFPSAIYVNNVSGHFRPDQWTAASLSTALRKSIRLPDQASVISIANDGAHVSGRLASLMAAK